MPLNTLHMRPVTEIKDKEHFTNCLCHIYVCFSTAVAIYSFSIIIYSTNVHHQQQQW